MPAPIVFDGGSDADRARLLELHQAYLDANATFDVPELRKLWGTDPTNVFFNLNGQTYVGVEHWTRLWDYYGSRLQTGTWTPDDLKVVVRGDMAMITCHRLSPTRWIGSEPRPETHPDKLERRSRSTMVFVREGGDWRVAHTHFSEMSTGPRPGGI